MKMTLIKWEMADRPILRRQPLKIPAIRDRVIQGAVCLILEPIFEADFQPGSYGYRPGRSAHDPSKNLTTLAIRNLRITGVPFASRVTVIALPCHGRASVVRTTTKLRPSDTIAYELPPGVTHWWARPGNPPGGMSTNVWRSASRIPRPPRRARAERASRGGFCRRDRCRATQDFATLLDRASYRRA